MNTKINSFEAACDLMGYDPIKSLPDVSNMPEKYRQPTIADYKVAVINEALNKEFAEKKKLKDVFPDYTKGSQWKNFAWWDVDADDENPSGSGLRYLDFGLDGTVTYVGSRFLLRDSKLVEYSAEKFKDLHECRLIGKAME